MSSDPNNGSVPHTSMTVPWRPFRADDEASLTFDITSKLMMETGRNNKQCDFIDAVGVEGGSHLSMVYDY